MPIEIRMPTLSPTRTHAKLARWHKQEGDFVQSGEVIAEIETDKATMEVEASHSGRLGRLLVAEDTPDIAIDHVIAILLQEGETLEGSRAPANTGNRMSMREALRDAMAEEMRADERVFLIGEEVGDYQGAYKVSEGLLEEFGPRRLIDTPATQQGFAGLAIGAAMAGLKPIVEFMTWNYGMAAMDQIVNLAAKTHYMSGGTVNIPIVFRGPNGAASRVAAQHAHDFSSWFAHCPGLKVIAPSNAADAKGLLKAAIRDPNPVIILENEALYAKSCEVPSDPNYIVPLSEAHRLRTGTHVTITAFAGMVEVAMQAAETLAADGIEAEIIDLRSLRPLDRQTIITSVQKTNRLVSVEAGWPTAGIGAEIASIVMEEAFDYLDAPVVRITGKDTPMPYAANLEHLALPQVDDITAAARAVCYRSH